MNLKPMQTESLEKLVIQRMPFGIYKDSLLCDLPGNYLAWFAREGFPSGDLGGLLQLMHEIDHNDLRQLLIPLKNKGF